MIKRIISHTARGCLAIREIPWHYTRTDKRSLTYEWICRGCGKTNKQEFFEPNAKQDIIRCSFCELKIERDHVEGDCRDWFCMLPDKNVKTDHKSTS